MSNDKKITLALHILPDPEKALREIDRVLKEDGLLIAPNFVNHKKGVISTVWSKVLGIASVKFEHQWSVAEYDGNGTLLEELSSYANPKSKLSRMVKNGECFSITKGLYETDRNVPAYLLAGSIYGPSYIPFDYARHVPDAGAK